MRRSCMESWLLNLCATIFLSSVSFQTLSSGSSLQHLTLSFRGMGSKFNKRRWKDQPFFSLAKKISNQYEPNCDRTELLKRPTRLTASKSFVQLEIAMSDSQFSEFKWKHITLFFVQYPFNTFTPISRYNRLKWTAHSAPKPILPALPASYFLLYICGKKWEQWSLNELSDHSYMLAVPFNAKR